MTKELESDKWQQVPVPKYYELIVEYFHNPSFKAIRTATKNEMESTNEKLISDETPYWVTNSLLSLLEIIYDYMRMTSFFPTISFECSNKLVEIIKTYNNKASHLVLGAGAVQLNKMKNITAKHLALSSQNLCFLLWELPHIKGRIELQLNEKAKGLIDEDFISIKKDFVKHRDDIYKKLSSLLSIR